MAAAPATPPAKIDPLASREPEARAAVGLSAMARQQFNKPPRPPKRYKVSVPKGNEVLQEVVEADNPSDAWAKACDKAKHSPGGKVLGRKIEQLASA